MTDDKITLQGLLEKFSDACLLREMIGFAAQRLRELEKTPAVAPAMANAPPNASSRTTNGPCNDAA